MVEPGSHDALRQGVNNDAPIGGLQKGAETLLTLFETKVRRDGR